MDDAGAKPGDQSFIATVIIVIGIAWMSLTGLCTAVFAVGGLISTGANDLLSLLPMIAVIGWFCMFPGFLIWSLGRWLRRRKQKSAERAARQD